MFVSTPSQMSADAAQTGFIGPSVPADAGSGAGFAAWLNGSAQPGDGLQGSAATPQGAKGTVSPLQFFPLELELAAGTAGQNAAGTNTAGTFEGANAVGFQSGPRSGSGSLSGAHTDVLLQSSGLHKAQADGQANQPTGQQSLLQLGADGSPASGQKPGAATTANQATPAAQTTLTDAQAAETALNRLGLAAMAKELTDPLAQRTSALSSGRADPSGSGNRAGVDPAPQGQVQLTDSGFRSQILQGGASQNQGQNASGQGNPSINSADIAVQMARNKADGNNQFTIRLTPQSMGTITVRLNISNNANLTAQLQVEKPETLALLQKDLAGLEKALKAQGFSTGDGDLTIALKTSSLGVRGGEAAMNSAFGQNQNQGQNAGQNLGQNQTQNQTQNQAQNQAAAQSQGSGTAAQSTPTQPTQLTGMDRPAPAMHLSSGDMGFQQSHHESGAHGQDGFEHAHGDPASSEPEDLDPGLLEHADLIASAYHGQNLLIGMSTQLDLSV